jgi:NAD-dependent deacetylase
VYEQQIDRARALIDAAEAVAVLAGAGISTDSGIADFRGPQGLWTKDPQAEKQAHISYYVSDPEVRKARWQRTLDSPLFGLEPNPGHVALVELERRGKLHTLVTQNVDGLHHKAGNDPSKIVEVHGNVREVKCLDCGERAAMERALARVRAGEADPPCRTCGGILKSATVSFGQGLDRDDIDRFERAAVACDLLLCVGSTLSVWPVAGMVPLAHQTGSRIVIVNAEPTEYDALADVVARGSLSEVLPMIVGAAT